MKGAEFFGLSTSEFEYRYTVLMSDIDLFKHMSYANYLKLLFYSSDALLLDGITESFMKYGRLRLMKTSMHFKYQTRLGERILIKINSANIGAHSFDLLHSFVLEGNQRQIGYGMQSFVVEKLYGETEIFIPDSLMAMLRQIESIQIGVADNANYPGR